MSSKPTLDPAGGNAAPLPRPPAWLRRIGVAGFLFFLVKGLLWLLVPALLVGRRWFGD